MNPGKYKPFFKIVSASVSNEQVGDDAVEVKASVCVSVDSKKGHLVSIKGDGPVDALGKAFVKALSEFYPEVKEVALEDYKVRIVNSKAGTAAKVRVIIEFRDKNNIRKLVADIIDRGVALCGGGALLRGVDKLLTKSLGIPAYLVDTPLTCVVEGAVKALPMYNILRRSLPQV